MPIRKTLAGLLAGTLWLTGQSSVGLRNLDLDAIDKSCKPCEDFYQYSIGKWHAANPIPASRTRWGKRWAGADGNEEVLKTILDVVSVALVIGTVGAAALTIAVAVLAADPTLLDPTTTADLSAQGLIGAPGLVLLAAAFFYLGGVLVIISRLRRIFATLTAGDPFRPENVGRLQLAGAMLAALELSRYPYALLSHWVGSGGSGARFGFNPTAWFAVLVVFVLAEVFREGARLRREAELTI